MNPFDFFDQIYCINLPQSEDRREQASERFQRLGILDRVQWIYAEPPRQDIFIRDRVSREFSYPVTMVGVSLSHLKVFTTALASGAKNILVFEDDVTFTSSAAHDLQTATANLPSDWEALYLGGEPIEPTQTYSVGLVSVNKFLGLYAYALSRPAIEKWALAFIDNITRIAGDGIPWDLTEAAHQTYCVYPPICVTLPNRSTITGRDENYDAETQYAWSTYKPS